MSKRVLILPVLLVGLGLAGCQSHTAKKPTAASTKTVITSKQYTTSQLEKRFIKTVDSVVKPLNMASYSKPAKAVQAQAKTSATAVAAVRLQLVANNSQPDQTKALIGLCDAAKAMLEAMQGKDQAAYNRAAKAFMDQTSGVAKRYYGGRVPNSLSTYSQRMSAAK